MITRYARHFAELGADERYELWLEQADHCADCGQPYNQDAEQPECPACGSTEVRS